MFNTQNPLPEWDFLYQALAKDSFFVFLPDDYFCKIIIEIQQKQKKRSPYVIYAIATPSTVENKVPVLTFYLSLALSKFFILSVIYSLHDNF